MPTVIAMLGLCPILVAAAGLGRAPVVPVAAAAAPETAEQDLLPVLRASLEQGGLSARVRDRLTFLLQHAARMKQIVLGHRPRCDGRSPHCCVGQCTFGEGGCGGDLDCLGGRLVCGDGYSCAGIEDLARRQFADLHSAGLDWHQVRVLALGLQAPDDGGKNATEKVARRCCVLPPALGPLRDPNQALIPMKFDRSAGRPVNIPEMERRVMMAMKEPPSVREIIHDPLGALFG